MSLINKRSTTKSKFGKTSPTGKAKNETEKSPSKKSKDAVDDDDDDTKSPLYDSQDMAMSRKSSVRISPLKQNVFEFIDTVVFDISKVADIKRTMSRPIRGSTAKVTALTKSWAQSIVEQIILFYKIIVFHQDAVRIVLELINTIATADDTRIDEIVRLVKGKQEIDGLQKKGVEGGVATRTRSKKNPLNKTIAKVIDRDDPEWKNNVRAKVNTQDTEDQEQDARRVRAFKQSRRLRLAYFLIYHSYRITPNEVVKLGKKHPHRKFLAHFNKFIKNKADVYYKTPSVEKPKNRAAELKLLRENLLGRDEAEDMSEWEKMYLMSALLNQGKPAGTVMAPGGLLKTNFGSNVDLPEEFKNLEREIYEFALERVIWVIFDIFALDRAGLKKFVDQYGVVAERQEKNRDRTTSEKAEDYITQMQACTNILRRGILRRPVNEFKNGEKVYEYLTEDSFVTRPIQILKEVPDYPEWARRISEAMDHKTWLINQCGRPNVACMPELSVGRVMYFIMTHLVLIHRILMRIAAERITAAGDSKVFTTLKKKRDLLVALHQPDDKDMRDGVIGTGVTKRILKLTRRTRGAEDGTLFEPIHTTDIYSMAILDTEQWTLGQKADDDVLIGFVQPRVLKRFKLSSKQDPHEKITTKKGLIPRMLEYNDFENVIYRTFQRYKRINTRIGDYERVFLSYALSRFSRVTKSLRADIRLPLMSVSEGRRYIKAKKRARAFIEDTKFGILQKKAGSHGIIPTIKYLASLNKKLNSAQKSQNKRYIKYLLSGGN
ncbi:MAG: hypothetical protein CMM25_02895 [Rhodospirillaceae bacterium]|nr:hypothetical protein [Rhodospirillaceae bacterium]